MFSRATIPIDGLLVGYEAALTEVGYSFSTKLRYLKCASLIIRRHQNNGLDCLEPEIFLNNIKSVDERFLSGGMKKHYYEGVRRAIEKFIAYISSGVGVDIELPENILTEFVILIVFNDIYNRLRFIDHYLNARIDIQANFLQQIPHKQQPTPQPFL